jgi:ATP-binding cassette subfamily B protein
LFDAAARPLPSGFPEAGKTDINQSNESGIPAPLMQADNLAFSYRGRQVSALQHVSVEIRKGEYLLVNGPSGSGKSTLVSLLAGLRSPESGTILLGGLDRETLRSEGWRRRVATAPQFHENHVFTETFAFNLLMGRRWPPTTEDLAEAQAICEELGLGKLLQTMPAGLFQIVGETGWRLSHGERSRLYIARALLQGGDVVILDEGLAALDPENRSKALECVLKRAPTLILVAHP